MKIQYQKDNITVFESALYRTTSCLVETSDLVLLVDPNLLPEEIRYIREQLQLKADNRPVYLLFTHSDYDHILGYRAFPGVTVICSASLEQHTDKQKAIDQIKSFDEEYYIERDYPVDFPEGDVLISKPEEVLKIGQTRLHFFQAPGHTADSLFTYVESCGCLIAGDYLSNVEFPFIYDSSQAYLETLKQASRIIDEYEVKILIPGHGDVTEEQEEMRRRIKDSETYLLELQASLEEGEAFDINKYLDHYGFRKALSKAHQENIVQMKKEWERDTREEKK